MRTHLNIQTSFAGSASHSRATVRAVFALTAVAATIGLLAIALAPSKVAEPRVTAQALAAIPLQRVAKKEPATREIVASPVIDSSPVYFIGTGDGSSGTWTRP